MKRLKRRVQNVLVGGVTASLILASFSGVSFVQPKHVEAGKGQK